VQCGPSRARNAYLLLLRNDSARMSWLAPVAQSVKAMGGFQRMTEILEVIKEAGGVKKFKDLAEAMIATETDAIPF
jgi:hypothetical protein